MSSLLRQIFFSCAFLCVCTKKADRAIEGKLGEVGATTLEATPNKNGKGGGRGRPMTTAENAVAAVKGNELHVSILSERKARSWVSFDAPTP